MFRAYGHMLAARDERHSSFVANRPSLIARLSAALIRRKAG